MECTESSVLLCMERRLSRLSACRWMDDDPVKEPAAGGGWGTGFNRLELLKWSSEFGGPCADAEDSTRTGARRLIRLWAVRSRRKASEESLAGSVWAFSFDTDDLGDRRLTERKTEIELVFLNI